MVRDWEWELRRGSVTCEGFCVVGELVCILDGSVASKKHARYAG